MADSIDIWRDTPVKDSVSMTHFPAPADKNTGVAIIVCPGGSYFWNHTPAEGTEVALWLQQHGISAFVLRYRVAGSLAFMTFYRCISGGNKHPYPIQDAQRALQIVRQNAKQFDIDPDKVGIMGFSAGGHLAMFACQQADTDYLAPLGIENSESLRPSFCAMLYPVVTLTHKQYTHTRSRRAVLGEKCSANQHLRQLLSLELNVTDNLPPVFMANCIDDSTVHYRNCELMQQALDQHNIPNRYIQYQIGGHGFGASETKGSAECRQWKTQFINWLTDMGLING